MKKILFVIFVFFGMFSLFYLLYSLSIDNLKNLKAIKDKSYLNKKEGPAYCYTIFSKKKRFGCVNFILNNVYSFSENPTLINESLIIENKEFSIVGCFSEKLTQKEASSFNSFLKKYIKKDIPFKKESIKPIYEIENKYNVGILNYIKDHNDSKIVCYDSKYMGPNTQYTLLKNKYHEFNTNSVKVKKYQEVIYLKDNNSSYYPVINCFDRKKYNSFYSRRKVLKNIPPK